MPDAYNENDAIGSELVSTGGMEKPKMGGSRRRRSQRGKSGKRNGNMRRKTGKKSMNKSRRKSRRSRH